MTRSKSVAAWAMVGMLGLSIVPAAQASDFAQAMGFGYGPGYNAPGQSGYNGSGQSGGQNYELHPGERRLRAQFRRCLLLGRARAVWLAKPRQLAAARLGRVSW